MEITFYGPIGNCGWPIYFMVIYYSTVSIHRFSRYNYTVRHDTFACCIEVDQKIVSCTYRCRMVTLE